jgi:hypothetical protein
MKKDKITYMEVKKYFNSFFGKQNQGKTILKDGITYTTGRMVFKARGDCEYDPENGSSIPYYWLVDLISKSCHENSSLGLPRGNVIQYANEGEQMKATMIYEQNQISFTNVRRLIMESKNKLDDAMQMLNKLQNGQQG